MTIAHGLRSTCDLNFNSAAKAASHVIHDFHLSWLIRLGRLSGLCDGDPVHELYCVIDAVYCRALRHSAANAFDWLARELALLCKTTEAQPALHGCHEFPA